ncbi:MAG: hypothetical protein ACJ75B_21020 [Flavisolibacter sp.]
MKDKLRALHRQAIYFPFLLPVFFVFHGFTEMFPQIGLSPSLVLLLQYLLGVVVLFFVFFLFLGSQRKSAVFVFLLLGFYFFFGTAHDAIKSLMPASFLVKYSIIIPFFLLFFIVVFIFLKRTQRRFPRLTRYLNLLLLVLILIDVVQLARKLPGEKKSAGISAGMVLCDSCARPDIYFIIADEYAGRHELQDIFHFDNSSFENSLQKRGFKVVDSSLSNYNYTPFCIASLLSMNYLQGIEGRNKSRSDRHTCYQIINQNPLFNFLNAEGYQIRNLSVFQCDNQLPEAPSSFFLTGKDLLTSQTFFSRIQRDLGFNLITRLHLQSVIKNYGDREKEHIEYLFDATKKEAQEQVKYPRFIYTHLMMPHYPYFFDSTGQKNPAEVALEGSQVNKKQYIGYLQFANTRFLELIDFILTHSKQPPIIIFMGDHGFRHFIPDQDHKYYFMNLNAIFLPPGDSLRLYRGMSSVNEFRAVLNSAFHQHLNFLPDSTRFLTE